MYIYRLLKYPVLTFLMLIPLLCFCDVSNQINLWEKAVEISRLNINWIPGNLYLKNIMKDNNGKIKNSTELWAETSSNTNGGISNILIKYIENGDDVTEKKMREFNKPEEKKENKNERKFSLNLSDMNPFDPDSQSNITISNTGIHEYRYDKECYIFEYRRKMPGDIFQTGSAWIDEATGLPAAVKFTLDPLPRFVSGMTNTILYNTAGGESNWYPSLLTMQGTGGFLFIKMNIISTTILSNYWRK